MDKTYRNDSYSSNKNNWKIEDGDYYSEVYNDPGKYEKRKLKMNLLGLLALIALTIIVFII